jgi:hypothetical protein
MSRKKHEHYSDGGEDQKPNGFSHCRIEWGSGSGAGLEKEPGVNRHADEESDQGCAGRKKQRRHGYGGAEKEEAGIKFDDALDEQICCDGSARDSGAAQAGDYLIPPLHEAINQFWSSDHSIAYRSSSGPVWTFNLCFRCSRYVSIVLMLNVSLSAI